jgi:pumilio RNA-binding family
MVVLETTTMGSSLLGGPYAQGAPALKMLQKRYLGMHQWLGPVCTSKDLKEHIVSFKFFYQIFHII